MTVMTPTWLRRRLALALAAAMLGSPAWRPLPSASSSAFHLKLLKASPAQDSTVSTPPTEIRLWFSMAPELKLTTIHLTTKSGTEIALAPLVRGPANDASVAAPIRSTLGAGSYHVAWRTMSSDGHVVKGEYAFAVAGSTTARTQR